MNDEVRRAIAYVSAATGARQCALREAQAVRDGRWTLEQIDMIRLAGIARRQALTYRDGCCTVTKRQRNGRARACTT